MRARGLAGACAVVLAGIGTIAATPPRGFYSAAAAEEGARLYAERCAMCHGAALEGTHEVPGLTGKFVANWAGRPVGDLPAYLGRAMPQFAPMVTLVFPTGVIALIALVRAVQSDVSGVIGASVDCAQKSAGYSVA